MTDPRTELIGDLIAATRVARDQCAAYSHDRLAAAPEFEAGQDAYLAWRAQYPFRDERDFLRDEFTGVLDAHQVHTHGRMTQEWGVRWPALNEGTQFLYTWGADSIEEAEAWTFGEALADKDTEVVSRWVSEPSLAEQVTR